MIDYGLFSRRLGARGDRWGLLIELQREWGFVGAGNAWVPPVVEPEDGDYDDDDPYDGPAEYAHVPAAVTEWYALPENSFLQAPRLYWTHPDYPPSRWPTTKVGRFLTEAGVEAPPALGLFMGEYEACWIWAYREAEALVDDDPPVYVANPERTFGELVEDIADGTEAGMNVRVARSVSEWALAFVVANLPFGMARLLDKPDELAPGCVDRELVAEHRHWTGSLTGVQAERVRAEFPELGLMPWWDFAGGSLHGGPDVLLMLAEPREGWPDSGTYLSLAARTAGALEAALARIGVEGAGA